MMRHLFITLLTPLAHFFSRVNPNTLTIFSLITGMLAGLSYWLTLLLNNTLGAQIEASFGQRRYGPGKAELFVGLVIFSVFMAFFPDISLRVGKNTITFINILFFLLGTASIGSIIHRFYKVHKLCSINIAEKKDGT